MCGTEGGTEGTGRFVPLCQGCSTKLQVVAEEKWDKTPRPLCPTQRNHLSSRITSSDNLTLCTDWLPDTPTAPLQWLIIGTNIK